MKRRFIHLLIYLFVSMYESYSQDIIYVDKWMEYVNDLAEDSEDKEQIEMLFNELSYLSEHPININQVLGNELQKLPFLSSLQINEIIAYIKRYGSMASVYELKMISSLDQNTIELLLPFIYIGEKENQQEKLSFNKLIQYGKNELAIKYDQCFQQKRGYKPLAVDNNSTSLNQKYEGQPFYNSLRYNYAFKDKLQAGFMAEKDAGEPIFNKLNRGYDFYTAHLFYRDTGLIRSVALGDYKASFGQGLILSQDFTPSRSMIETQGERRNNGFRRHNSTNEYDFFRGIAATLGYKKLEWSLFYSYKALDATFKNNEITSIKTDGLHRTWGERAKMRKAPMQTYGTNLRYATTHFILGVSAVGFSLNKHTINPVSQPYNLYYFRGSNHYNVSLDYLYQWNKIKIFGETAIDKQGALATLNGVNFKPLSYLSLLLMQRSYGKKYQAFYGNAFGQNSAVQNEEGVYIGMEINPFPHWRFSLYSDVYRFPWIRYGTKMPTGGKEYQIQSLYTRNSCLSFQLRYRYKESEESNQQRMRLRTSYSINNCWLLKTSFDAVYYTALQTKSVGWMLSQSIGYKQESSPIQFDFYGSYFHTDDYFSRISSYEKNILYTYSIPSFYGEGVRFAASIKYTLNSRVYLYIKLADTYYLDRTVIGTALEEIRGKNKTDIYTLLRWMF